MSEIARSRAGWQSHLPPAPYAVLALILAAGLLTAGAAYVSPWFAFHAMRSAASAGDVQGLAEVVDFGAVRASLTPQVDAYLPEEPPTEQASTTTQPRPRWWPDFVPWPLVQTPSSGPLERFTRPVTRPLRVRREIDRLTTPQSLSRLAAGRAHVRDWGLRRFRISTVDQGRETVWTLRRRGWFDWDVTHLGLPRPTATPRPSGTAAPL